jgi:hypothetical protein
MVTVTITVGDGGVATGKPAGLPAALQITR